MELKLEKGTGIPVTMGLLIVPYGIETEYQIVIILGQGLLILPFNLKLGN